MKPGPADWAAERIRQEQAVSRREYLGVLTKLSGGLLLASAGVAAGMFARKGSQDGPVRRVAGSIAAGEAVTFFYPEDDDPAIALRLEDGTLRAFSSTCSHLGCVVLWRQASGVLECPCHKGIFEARTGAVMAGPPPRPLSAIRIEERSDGIYATGRIG
ncbi:MAG: ubiquinol-cytochrome c reductase iron-sulfur subunit [Actinomycetota bacterium]